MLHKTKWSMPRQLKNPASVKAYLASLASRRHGHVEMEGAM